MFRRLFEAIRSRIQNPDWIEGFLYGLSGPMMMAVEHPFKPTPLSPLPDFTRPRLSREEAFARAFNDVEGALRDAFALFEELRPIAAQAQAAHR